MSASDRDMAPRASAEAHRRRERVSALYQSALVNNAHKLSGKPADLKAGLHLWLFQLCRDAAHAGEDAPAITQASVDRFYWQFISQTRAQRFGPIAFVSPTEWRQQIDQLCEEYGWKWVDPVKQEARAA